MSQGDGTLPLYFKVSPAGPFRVFVGACSLPPPICRYVSLDMAVTSAPVSSLNLTSFPFMRSVVFQDCWRFELTVPKKVASKFSSLVAAATVLEKHWLL